MPVLLMTYYLRCVCDHNQFISFLNVKFFSIDLEGVVFIKQ